MKVPTVGLKETLTIHEAKLLVRTVGHNESNYYSKTSKFVDPVFPESTPVGAAKVSDGTIVGRPIKLMPAGGTA